MPYPSLFGKCNIKTVRLAKCFNNLDNQTIRDLQQIDDARAKAISSIESRTPCYDQALKQIDEYLRLLSSFVTSFKKIESLDKKQQSIILPKPLNYCHRSPLTGVEITTELPEIEEYLFHQYFILISIDKLATSFSSGDKAFIQKALARVDYLQKKCGCVVIEGEEFMDFKQQLLGIFDKLLSCFLLILGAKNAEKMNLEAAELPPYKLKFSYQTISGIYFYALGLVENIELQIQYENPKNRKLQLPPEFKNFFLKVKFSCSAMAHFYMNYEFDVNNISGAYDQQQCACQAQIYNDIAQYQQLSSIMPEVNNMFQQTFGPSVQTAASIMKQGNCQGIQRFPAIGEVKRGDEFVEFQPTWTELKQIKK